jgi:hypothetical protein
MGKKSHYAVKVGREPGIYATVGASLGVVSHPFLSTADAHPCLKIPVLSAILRIACV